MVSNADGPGYENGDPLYPAGDPLPDPPPYSQIQFYPTAPPPVYRAAIERDVYMGGKERYEAEAPTAQEAGDLLWKLQYELGPNWDRRAHVAGADIRGGEAVFPISSIEERDARIAALVKERDELREALQSLVAVAIGNPICPFCGASGAGEHTPIGAAHFATCPVPAAAALLGGHQS